MSSSGGTVKIAVILTLVAMIAPWLVAASDRDLVKTPAVAEVKSETKPEADLTVFYKSVMEAFQQNDFAKLAILEAEALAEPLDLLKTDDKLLIFNDAMNGPSLTNEK